MDGVRRDGLLVELRGLVSRLGTVVADLDVEDRGVEEALELLSLFAQARKAAAAGEVLASGRVAACRGYERTGHRSAAHLLAEVGGTSVARAVEVVETAERLGACDATTEALRAGSVSVEQASAVSKAVVEDPTAEEGLLALAERAPLRALETRAREVRLAAEGDEAARYARQRAARTVRHGIDDEGMGWGHWRLPPDTHAAFVGVLETEADRQYRQAHADGRTEPHDRHLADALVTMCTRDGGEGPARPRAEVIVHVDHHRLVATDDGDGMCRVLGGGPIPVERARELLDDAFLKAVVHDGTDITRVQHFGRRRPAELDTALEARAVRRDGDVVCSVEGCDRRVGLHWDHIHPHAAGGPTDAENLQPLCRYHHRLKTQRDRMAARGGPMPP